MENMKKNILIISIIRIIALLLFGLYGSVILYAQINQDSIVSEQESEILTETHDVVHLPFKSVLKHKIIGSTCVIQGNQLTAYNSTDLRNAFSGIITGLDVRELNGAPGLHAEEIEGRYDIGQKVILTSRGCNPIFIIDDLVADVTEIPLDPQEIESITIVKDILGKTMFGPKAANGIIFIKTKRGRRNERIMDINAETGVSIVDRFPSWVTGADYAKLNNLARQNSQMTPLYSESDIDAYSKNDPYDKYHPNINFRDMLLNASRSFTRVNLSSIGGNESGDVNYFAYVGYNGEGDDFKLGSASGYDRLNIRSNIDLRVTDDIKARFGIFGGLAINRAPNYGYYTSETHSNFSILGMNPLLADINTIPPIAFPIYAAYDEEENIPFYGVSSTFGRNPVGSILDCGYFKETTRTSAANLSIDYDLSALIPRLRSTTYGTFNILNLIRIGKPENYNAFIATPAKTTDGKDTILLSKVHDGIAMADQTKLHDYYYQRFSFNETLSYDTSFGNNDLQLSLTYILSSGARDRVREFDKQQNAVLSAMYSYNDKYIVQGVLNLGGSSSFSKDKRYNLFPALGFGWIMSDEEFMKNLYFLNFLKLHIQGGILGYDGLSQTMYYNDQWVTNTSPSAFGPHPANRWFGTSNENPYRTYPSRSANPDLSWEKRKEFSVGFDALMFNEKLFFELSYYNNLRDGIIIKLSNTLPYITGTSAASPYQNFNKVRYFGLESGLQYSYKIGELRYSFGGNVTIQNSKILEFDEPNYRESYLSHIGRPEDAYWGYTFVGKYSSDQEAQAVIQDFDEVLFAGDLKYKDLNGDGIIDENDKAMIGNTNPRLLFSLNIKLNYKNIELIAIGTGRAFYDIPLRNIYFQNGWGDNTYSTFVQNNIGGSYPRLTYQKVNNNFLSSDFWLVNGNFFKVQNIEFAYNLPLKEKNIMNARLIRFHARGSNLFTISKIKDVDPESINAGITMYPLYRTFSGGLTITF